MKRYKKIKVFILWVKMILFVQKFKENVFTFVMPPSPLSPPQNSPVPDSPQPIVSSQYVCRGRVKF